MDLALFFVLPLIGGFAFVTDFVLLRYRTGREDSQRAYYRAALWAVALAGAAAVLHAAARAESAAYADFSSRVRATIVGPLLERERTTNTLAITPEAAAMRADVVLVCMYALVLGAATPCWNLLASAADRLWTRAGRRSFLDRLNLRAITDPLERLIAESLYAASAVQVTLDNAKVYVGVVVESPDPAMPAKYLKIQPWMSGHRRADDGRVDFNTFYDGVLADIDTDEQRQLVAATFQLVIPIAKIVSASGFDFGAYERFAMDLADREAAEAPADEPAAGARGDRPEDRPPPGLPPAA